MELQIAGTNMELTPAVQRYVERKLGKLNRHLPAIIESKVEISEEKTKSPQQHYLVRVTVTGGIGGAVFHGEERGKDLFQAVDRVAAIMIASSSTIRENSMKRVEALRWPGAN